MSNYPQKINIPGEKVPFKKFNLDHQHITTSAFKRLGVSFIREMTPGSNIKIDMQTFTRLNPIVLPTFGRMRIKHTAYYVPMRTVWRAWNAFITETLYPYATTGPDLVSNVPILEMGTLWSMFLYAANNLTTDLGSVGDAAVQVIENQWDFVHNAHAYKFTIKGRHYFKILEQLGYAIEFVAPVHSTGNWENQSKIQMSALPIMALGKLWLDWYENSAYIDTTSRLQVLKTMLENPSPSQTISDGAVYLILELTYHTYYENSLFVSAFDNPIGYNENNINRSIDDVSIGSSLSKSAVNSFSSGRYTPLLQGDINGVYSSTPYNISNEIINKLKEYTHYIKRNRLAGGRAVERLLVNYGQNLSDAEVNYSEKIVENEIDINIMDVTSQSDTTGANLGAYAGKGYGSGNNTINYTADEFGYLFIVTTINPHEGYVQGWSRRVLHLTKFDFYNENFDALGSSAITQGEVLVPFVNTYNNRATTLALPTDVFGFAPNYYEYKTVNDKLTGDYKVKSVNYGNDAWHLFRIFDYRDYVDSGTNSFEIKHNRRFTLGLDSAEYNRIFYSMDDIDQFNIIMNFNIELTQKMRGLYEDYDFVDDDGSDINLPLVGTKQN